MSMYLLVLVSFLKLAETPPPPAVLAFDVRGAYHELDDCQAEATARNLSTLNRPRPAGLVFACFKLVAPT